MAQFIIIADNQVENFTGKAMRNGIELQWKTIKPISVKSPQNKLVLPAHILDDDDIKEAFPALDALPQENENEIEFWQWDEDGNPY